MNVFDVLLVNPDNGTVVETMNVAREEANKRLMGGRIWSRIKGPAEEWVAHPEGAESVFPRTRSPRRKVSTIQIAWWQRGRGPRFVRVASSKRLSNDYRGPLGPARLKGTPPIMLVFPQLQCLPVDKTWWEQTHIHVQERALGLACTLRPWVPLHWLAYADWLEERGRRESERIRLAGETILKHLGEPTNE